MSIGALKTVRTTASLPDSLVREIICTVRAPHLALMVYGSHARGSADSASDVDVLAVVAQDAGMYGAGRVAVTAYTPAHLHAMAQASSLFILHLMNEGIVLSDPQGILERALLAYVPPGDYATLRAELRAAASALHVTDRLFADFGQALTRLGIYILRTALYVEAAESGHPVFDMPTVARDSGHASVATACALRRQSSFTRDDLLVVTDAIGLILGTEKTRQIERPTELQSRAIALATEYPQASALLVNVLFGDATVDYVALAMPPW